MANNIEETKKTLILGDDFEKALISAADVKNTEISTCKERNKNNYMGFYDIMLGSRVDVQEAMNKKGKSKTDADVKLVKEFKANTSNMYKSICDLISEDEHSEDGEEEHETKIQKKVSKIANVVQMMRYIGKTEIEDEFKKYGIELNFKNLEDEKEMFSQSHIKDTMKQIFTNGKTIKEDIGENNFKIKTEIYESSVPIDLQYDKSSNPTGIKPSDFCKLVDLKAKLLKAQNEEAKDKVKELAEKVASDYVFQNARNNIINKKITELSI